MFGVGVDRDWRRPGAHPESSSVCSRGDRLHDKPGGAGKVLRFRLDGLDGFRRNARIKVPRDFMRCGQQRMSTEYGAIRQQASAKQHAISSHKAMIANAHGLAALARLVEIDAVGEDLRAKPGKGAECSNLHFIGAIDDVAAGDGGVPFDDEPRFAVRVQFEVMAYGSERKCGNPIERPNMRKLVEPEQRQAFANRKRPDVSFGTHLQASRRDERAARDESGFVNLEPTNRLKNKASQAPGKRSRERGRQYR